MSDFRTVPVSDDQARVLDEVVVPMLMRAGDERSALLMMSLSLACRFAPKPEPVMPTNVVAFPDQHSRRVGA
jgi:hypothetical protein